MTEKTVQVGERLAVSYDITNRGQSDGEQTVELWLGGEVVDSEALVLDTGEKDRMSLVTDAFTDEDDGQLYEVEIVTEDRVARVMTVEVTTIPDSVELYVNALESFDESDEGTTVSTWPDTLGNFDLTGGNPEVVASGVNGQRSVLFRDSPEDILSNTSVSLSGPFTIIGLFRRRESDNSSSREVAGSNATNSRLKQGTGDSNRIEDDNRDNIIDGSATAQEDILMSGIFDGSDSKIREDGVQTASGSLSTTTLDGFDIGRATIFDDFFGDAGAFAVYSDNLEKTGEIDSEEQRIADSYGYTI